MDEEDVPGGDEAFERWADRAGFDPGEETEGGRNDIGDNNDVETRVTRLRADSRHLRAGRPPIRSPVGITGAT